MLSWGSPSISLCSEHPTQHPEHCVQPRSLQQKGLLCLDSAFLLALPIVLSCCFPCPPLSAAPTPGAPSASLFPGCIPREASAGHEPFPPSTDCICCLRTMTDWLARPQRAAAESHAPSIYPRSFYDLEIRRRGAAPATAFGVPRRHSHRDSSRRARLSAEGDFCRGSTLSWGEAGSAALAQPLFDILRGKHGCTRIKPLQQTKIFCFTRTS